MVRRFASRPLVSPRNLTTELVELLAGEITGGRRLPGERLPTELEMMASFGVSRTVVREAISALRSEGLVLTRQGLGAFVTTDVQRRPFRIDPDGLGSLDEVLHVMELRKSVEIEAAGLAAERCASRGLGGIQGAFDRIAGAIACGEAAIEADFEFHRAIAQATGNAYFPKFIEFLGHYIIPRQTVRIEQRDADGHARYLHRVQGEHRAIREAIAERDPQKARAAMRSHLDNSVGRYRRFGKGLKVGTAGKMP